MILQVEFEGEATDGGFALDDVTFYDGNCQSKTFLRIFSFSFMSFYTFKIQKPLMCTLSS